MLLPDPADVTVPHRAPLPLDLLIDAVDTTMGDEPGVADGGALLRVTGHPPQVAALPLAGDHPLDMLLGFTAPVHWRAVGLHCRAVAYALRDPAGHDQTPPGRDGGRGAAEPVVVTVLVDRTGAGSGLLRRGPRVTRLPGPPEGSVGDACRRALGLPTPAPPPGTAELWLRVWLDRVVEAAGGLTTWPDLAALHPAAPARPRAAVTSLAGEGAGDVGFDDPEALAETTHVLASAWPWDRLRREPDVVDGARPPLPREVTAWMDDGMFARWVLADLPDLGQLRRDVHRLLPPPVAAAVDATVRACGLGGPPPAPVSGLAGTSAGESP